MPRLFFFSATCRGGIDGKGEAEQQADWDQDGVVQVKLIYSALTQEVRPKVL